VPLSEDLLKVKSQSRSEHVYVFFCGMLFLTQKVSIFHFHTSFSRFVELQFTSADRTGRRAVESAMLTPKVCKGHKNFTDLQILRNNSRKRIHVYKKSPIKGVRTSSNNHCTDQTRNIAT